MVKKSLESRMLIKDLLELLLRHEDLFEEGLCLWITTMREHNLFSLEDSYILRNYVWANRPSKYSSIDVWIRRDDPYYWKISELKPRIKWIKKHIRRNS